jgi:hypothetical protein
MVKKKEIIQFGSYPQTEVTDWNLTSRIDAIMEENSPCGDVKIDGARYRRISRESTTSGRYFGCLKKYRYFRWEPVKWRVLTADGEKTLLLADEGLDCIPYHNVHKPATWETCSLRQWLNGDFLNTAFSEDEKEAVLKVTLYNPDNPDYGTSGGNDTRDSIFLLSQEHAENTFIKSEGIRTASDYAKRRGVRIRILFKGCRWWLRSPGGLATLTSYVDDHGNVNGGGYYACHHCTIAVVPALYLNPEQKNPRCNSINE